MKIKEYSAEYAQRMRHICIETSDAKGNERQERYTCALYCDWYLENGIAYMLLDGEDEAQGYILCAPSCGEYAAAKLPRLDLIHRLTAHMGLSIYKRYAEEYPAHLHADILPGYTGKGYGTALMETLCTRLRKQGVKGLMLQAGSKNSKAIRFYEKQGFTVLNKGLFVTAMGKKL